MAKDTTSTRSIGDEAVQAKTGRGWKEWFSILDSAGASNMSHKEIVALVSKTYDVGPWWQQMITVEYERARGLRAKHQTPAGFEISATKTIPASVSRLYRAWTDAGKRELWLGSVALTVRKSTPNRSLRITWTDGLTSVDVGFYPRQKNRCMIAVQHSKLPNARAAARMKTYWSKALESLQSAVAS